MYVEGYNFYHTDSFVYLLLRSKGGIVASVVIVVIVVNDDDDDDDDDDDGDGNGNGDGDGDSDGDSGGGGNGDGNAARSGRGDFSIGGNVVARTADNTTSQTAGRRTM